VISDLAWACYVQDEYGEAIKLLKKAVRIDAGSGVLQAHLADAAWRAGRWDEARVAWRLAAARAPRGLLCDQALEHMDRAVSLNPMEARLRVEYAEMLCAVNRPRDCKRQLDRAVEIDRRLLPGSILHFNAAEKGRIELLKVRAEALLAGAATAPRNS